MTKKPHRPRVKCGKCGKSCIQRDDGLCGRCRHSKSINDAKAEHSHAETRSPGPPDLEDRIRRMQHALKIGASPSKVHTAPVDMTPEEERLYREVHCGTQPPDPNREPRIHRFTL